MKFQWTWFLALIFAILIAIFSIANVDAVPVSYVFGKAELPLVLVILGAALVGALISGLFAMFRSIMSKRHKNELLKDINTKEILIADQQNEIAYLQKQISHVDTSNLNEKKELINEKKNLND